MSFLKMLFFSITLCQFIYCYILVFLHFTQYKTKNKCKFNLVGFCEEFITGIFFLSFRNIYFCISNFKKETKLFKDIGCFFHLLTCRAYWWLIVTLQRIIGLLFKGSPNVPAKISTSVSLPTRVANSALKKTVGVQHQRNCLWTSFAEIFKSFLQLIY